MIADMQILHWQVNPELKKEAEDNYRTNFAISLKDRTGLEIIEELTFDGMAKKLTVSEIERLINFVEKKFLKKEIKGSGLEVGAGPGTFSSFLARSKNVDKVYALELCQPIVELLGPKVTEYLLGDRKDKVIGVVGDFDHMELRDNSVDFVFDFFSLHHSMDISVTLKECARILKPGGFIFCFDKARPNHYTREDLDQLLDTVYDVSYNKQFGLPLDQKITRRFNGEKEYRLKDWQAAFLGGGFNKFDYFYLAKTSGGKLSGAIKNLLALLPPMIQLPLNRLMPKPRFNHKFVLEPQNRIFSSLINHFPKEISLMIAYK